LDNSVIFWDVLDLPDICTVQLKFLLEFSLIDIICDAHDQMTPKTLGKLSGETSKFLQLSANKSKNKQSARERLMKALLFFTHQDGDAEFASMVSILDGKGPDELFAGDSYAHRVKHISDIVTAY
jgi:hypothetical protein